MKNEQVCSKSKKEDMFYTLLTINYLDIFCDILYTEQIENLAILAQNLGGITVKHIC